MITLNIISDQQKAAIQSLKLFRLIRKICFSIFFVLILISLLLLASFLLLEQNRKKLTTEISVAEKQLNENTQSPKIKESIDRFNKKLGYLQAIQLEYRPLSPLIKVLTKTVPEGVELSSFNLNLSDKTFELSGTSVGRQQLLDFQEQLENTEEFFEINSPLSNLTQKENISFKLTGKIN